MHQNVLPGQKQPYFLESGEGQRHLLGPLLATTIGHRQDTGSLMEGVVLIGARILSYRCIGTTARTRRFTYWRGQPVCGWETRSSRWAAIIRAARPARHTALPSPATEPGF